MSLSPHVRALLRAGRAEPTPDGNEARVLAALGMAAEAASGVAGLALARATMRAWLKWVGLSVLVVTVVATVAAMSGRSPSTAGTEASQREGIEREPPSVIAPVTLRARARVELAAPVHATRPRSRSSRGVLVASSVDAVAPPAMTDRSAPADDELALIGDAKLALRRHDAGAALSALDAHARAFPGGAFRHEAAALRVETLVAAGRLEDARRAADAFDAAYPRSPYAPRVDALRRKMRDAD